jgi:putative nucleotidyltransferase with HDIG domain
MKTGPGILVVDDEERIRKFCREVLELQGYNVEEASNGREALRILARKSFSLVLSDIMMPDLGGLELTVKVKDLYPDTFVILITGHGTIETAKKAIQHGAFDFITKPFKMTELNQAVDRALEVRRRDISELPSPELMDLYTLTTGIDVCPRSQESFLSDLVKTLMQTFRGDAARVYLSESPGFPGLTTVIGAGKESILTDHDWRTYALAAQMDEGDMLVGPDTDIPLPPAGTATSIMAGPIPSMEGIMGVVVAVRANLPGGFTRRDLKLMGLFAAQAGNQLMNYRLAADLRLHSSELEKINLLTTSFSSSLDTSHVLSSIGKGLMTMVPFDLFGVFLSGEGLLPLSYVLARADMPDNVFSGQLRKCLEQYRDPGIVEQFLDSRYRDSFASLREADWTAAPDIRILDLGEYGSFGGMMILAAWSRHHAPLETSSFLPILVRHAAAALSNAYHYETSERNYIQAITALAGAVDAKDPYTSNHSRNVAAYAMAINRQINLTDREANWLHNAALLHDIGKIGIPESILNKTGALSDPEMEIIRKHPDMGYRILKPVTAFGGFIDAVRYHHERYDGRGYPFGLSGERIPFLARILTVADSFDAMTSDRVYRPSPGPDFARSEMVKHSRSQFDPDLVRLFSEVLSRSSPEDIIHEYISSDRRHYPLS